MPPPGPMQNGRLQLTPSGSVIRIRSRLGPRLSVQARSPLRESASRCDGFQGLFAQTLASTGSRVAGCRV